MNANADFSQFRDGLNSNVHAWLCNADGSGDAKLRGVIGQWRAAQFDGERLPPQCLLCCRDLPTPADAVLFWLMSNTRDDFVVSGICETCAENTPEELERRCMAESNHLPLGQCYRMAGERLMAMDAATRARLKVRLVHGVVQWPTPNRSHAWLEFGNGRVWDNTPADAIDLPPGWDLKTATPITATAGNMWSAERWSKQCQPEVSARYSRNEALQRFEASGNWGPWRD